MQLTEDLTIMGELILRKLFLIPAIAFICLAIFPFVFIYCISLLIQSVVSKQMAEKIDKFWDNVGKPYDYLIKAVE